MEIDSSKNTATYIELLKEILEQKLQVMRELLILTQQQNDALKSESFEEELFNELMNQKGVLLEKLDQLDTGFDRIYQQTNKEVFEHKELYRNVIRKLQDLIREITDISVNIQATESRNRDALLVILSSKRREIKNFKAQSNAVTNYYRNMANQNDMQSIFYDTKQ